MSICIFCHKDSSGSKSLEHIIPESLGNKKWVLPKGYVCDACNNYFARKIEKELLEQPYFVSLRFRKEILTKKNRLVKQHMIFPGAMKATDVIMLSTPDGVLASFDDEEIYEKIKTGNCHQMIAPYLPEPDFPNEKMSRFLAKCAYEYFLYNMGEEKFDLCVQEFMANKEGKSILDAIREYARYGKGEYWQYSQRRIYPESALFVDSKKKPYEILHEMKLFVKELTHKENNQIEAEIYFILAICGIEYSICLSDPDISEYNQWLKENNYKSPLVNESEKMLPYIYPNLI